MVKYWHMLNTEVQKLSGVGKANAAKLEKLGLKTVQDLLYFWPFRYEDYTKTTPVNELTAGREANIVVRIELLQSRRAKRRRMTITECLASDETGSIKIIWFNQPYISKTLKVGDEVSLSGKVDSDYAGRTMVSPVYEKVLYTTDHRTAKLVHTQGLVPIYHTTANLTQKQIRFLIKQALEYLKYLIDWLPDETQESAKLINLTEAIRLAHFPQNQESLTLAKKRLAFDELFLLQLQSQLAKRELLNYRTHPIPLNMDVIKKFVDNLPFKLTDAQRKSAWIILQDMEKKQPMSRILIGDVGSGKTIVAVMAMLNAVLGDPRPGQAVLMVPTEILAHQHYASLSRLFAGLNLKVGIITNSMKQISINFNDIASLTVPSTKAEVVVGSVKKTKKITAADIAQQAEILIGTHALIQQGVEFRNLKLAVIDEQHRFGVEQRKKLLQKISPDDSAKKIMPHLLSMTATPIPRSLALAIFGDLDVSVIDEMPKGRKKILTKLVEEKNRTKANQFIRDQINAGRQAFVICPLIDISDTLGIKSVKAEYERLQQEIFPDLKIGLLHGKLKSQEKETVMQEFLANKLNILVSTSVIEVGIDVPNASMMIIEGADRFGLAQLHQFRGRVGRGQHQSFCLLFTENKSAKTSQRLKAMVEISDGFQLAKLDLKFRGPGEVFGTEQKGFPQFKIATLFDYALMEQAKTGAEKIIKLDPGLVTLPALKNELARLGNQIHLE
jgi:ATP-dependent DNA helicase RecG